MLVFRTYCQFSFNVLFLSFNNSIKIIISVTLPAIFNGWVNCHCRLPCTAFLLILGIRCPNIAQIYYVQMNHSDINTAGDNYFAPYPILIFLTYTITFQVRPSTICMTNLIEHLLQNINLL